VTSVWMVLIAPSAPARERTERLAGSILLLNIPIYLGNWSLVEGMGCVESSRHVWAKKRELTKKLLGDKSKSQFTSKGT
jgi:tetrahydromethanopterin S-methyltransferase subunit D